MHEKNTFNYHQGKIIFCITEQTIFQCTTPQIYLNVKCILRYFCTYKNKTFSITIGYLKRTYPLICIQYMSYSTCLMSHSHISQTNIDSFSDHWKSFGNFILTTTTATTYIEKEREQGYSQMWNMDLVLWNRWCFWHLTATEAEFLIKGVFWT